MITTKSTLLLIIASCIVTVTHAQEPRIFTTSDFDLRGNVQFSMVLTDYGKEEFNFDKKGYLTKLVTRYNEQDYVTTYYKYNDSILTEKRVESYRDGEFDETTSIAHFYEMDTISTKKVTEKIFSYTNEALDQYEYQYNVENNLTSIKRMNTSGIDETIVERTLYKKERTTSYILNGIIQNSVRASEKKTKNGELLEIKLIKDFMEGKPIKAKEQIYNKKQELLSELIFAYDTVTKQFSTSSKTVFSYEEDGMLSKETLSIEGEEPIVKDYIYQYDGSDFKNWIKQIITPDNTYKTRRIEYYEEEPVSVEDE